MGVEMGMRTHFCVLIWKDHMHAKKGSIQFPAFLIGCKMSSLTYINPFPVKIVSISLVKHTQTSSHSSPSHCKQKH